MGELIIDFHLLIGTLSGRKELILADSLIVNDLDTIAHASRWRYVSKFAVKLETR